MKKKHLFIAFVFCIIFLGSSCTYNKQDICIAGKKGNIILNVFMKHEQHQVGNLKSYRDTVYVKYNVTSSSGISPSNYDAVFIGGWPGDSVCIANISCGNYLLYEVGYDNIHSNRATGEAFLIVNENDGLMNVSIEAIE